MCVAIFIECVPLRASERDVRTMRGHIGYMGTAQTGAGHSKRERERLMPHNKAITREKESKEEKRKRERRTEEEEGGRIERC